MRISKFYETNISSDCLASSIRHLIHIKLYVVHQNDWQFCWWHNILMELIIKAYCLYSCFLKSSFIKGGGEYFFAYSYALSIPYTHIHAYKTDKQ